MAEITPIENGFIVVDTSDSPLAKISFHRESGSVIVIGSTVVSEALRGTTEEFLPRKSSRPGRIDNCLCPAARATSPCNRTRTLDKLTSDPF